MKEEIIEYGRRIGYKPETIDGTLGFIDRYRLNFMGRKPEVVGAVSYRIMGLACGDPRKWEEIFAETGVQPRYAWAVYRKLLNYKSKRLDELGITKKQLENRVRNYMRGNGSSGDGEEISKIFRRVFLE